MSSNMFELPEPVESIPKGQRLDIFNGEYIFNTTCPPNLTGGFREKFRDQISWSNGFNSRMNSTISDDYGKHDACILEDEVREALLRKRRKDDSYKTALCDSYRQVGACVYGDHCRFAHGLRELRIPTQPKGRAHPNYKTVLCEKFSVTGYCKYGSRCLFIHKIANPALLKMHPEVRRELADEENPLINFFKQRSRDDYNQSLPLLSNQHDEVGRSWRKTPERKGRDSTSTHLELKNPSTWNKISFEHR